MTLADYLASTCPLGGKQPPYFHAFVMVGGHLEPYEPKHDSLEGSAQLYPMGNGVALVWLPKGKRMEPEYYYTMKIIDQWGNIANLRDFLSLEEAEQAKEEVLKLYADYKMSVKIFKIMRPIEIE